MVPWSGPPRSRLWSSIILIAAVILAVALSAGYAVARSTILQKRPSHAVSGAKRVMRQVTKADRDAAAARLLKKRGGMTATQKALSSGTLSAQSIKTLALTPNGMPDYFGGVIPNYALSQLPTLDASGNPLPGTGIRKFVDAVAGLGEAGANNLGQYIPAAVPDKNSYSGSDYYVIAVVEYKEKLHSDIPTTTLRGYVQIETPQNAGVSKHYALKYPNGSAITSGGVQLYGVDKPHYLGPAIVSTENRPTRIKFINKLPTGVAGNLFIPVDTKLMGAGMGPLGMNVPAGMQMNYTQNRATLHLHGNNTVWISDGTPHQWTTPAGENTPYPKGVSVRNVPDMDGGVEPTGTLTFYYTNQQSARLMFYHDHAYGITRLNVYAGEAAPYIIQDPVERKLVTGGSFQANGQTVNVAAGTIPADEVPLVIQDKTFVPDDAQLTAQDPTWAFGLGKMGNLWFPHVYMPNQNPADDSGINAMGRWDYGPWMFPPGMGMGVINGPVPNPLAGQPGQNSLNPGIPNPTVVPEAFMDTPLVNGTAYPFMPVQRKAYRFRILNASNDRMWNLQLYKAKSNGQMWNGTSLLDGDAGEVPMVAALPASARPATWPATWPSDGRDGGVPDPGAAGPQFVQISNEAGLLPSATTLPNQPVDYEYFRRTVRFGSVTSKTLYLGPAERADVIVDFSQLPEGTKVILYNDAPAPTPMFDTRYDFYTGDPDQVLDGGAPTTKAGYGPNTRTVMQFQVTGATAAPAFDVAQLQTALKAAYAATQEKPIVPEPEYGPAFNTIYPKNRLAVNGTTLSFVPAGQVATVTKDVIEKAIIEGFDMEYGRMNAQLGAVAAGTPLPQPPGNAQPLYYNDLPTEIVTGTPPGMQIGALADGTQIWRINHQGVDTHAIHFHLFDVQVIERVAMDGEVIMPDANEIGWKETVRMNPLVDTIVALRPKMPAAVPFKLPESVRYLDPTMPGGTTRTTTIIDFGVPITFTFTNTLQNFGWEYVWHCHLLGHEENDMMRPLVFKVTPATPTNLTAVATALSTSAPRINLAWTMPAGSIPATGFVIQRAADANFTTSVRTFSVNSASARTYTDTTVGWTTRYYYRVRAENAAAFTDWSNSANALTAGQLSLAPTNLHLLSRTRFSLSVGWTNPTTGVAAGSRIVQWKINGTTAWSQVVLPATTTSRSITGLLNGRNYNVRVGSSNRFGTAWSNTITVATLP